MFSLSLSLAVKFLAPFQKNVVRFTAFVVGENTINKILFIEIVHVSLRACKTRRCDVATLLIEECQMIASLKISVFLFNKQ